MQEYIDNIMQAFIDYVSFPYIYDSEVFVFDIIEFRPRNIKIDFKNQSIVVLHDISLDGEEWDADETELGLQSFTLNIYPYDPDNRVKVSYYVQYGDMVLFVARIYREVLNILEHFDLKVLPISIIINMDEGKIDIVRSTLSTCVVNSYLDTYTISAQKKWYLPTKLK